MKIFGQELILFKVEFLADVCLKRLESERITLSDTE